ncbi:hypothetical protein, partial [Providencia hangzhouensis]
FDFLSFHLVESTYCKVTFMTLHLNCKRIILAISLQSLSALLLMTPSITFASDVQAAPLALCEKEVGNLTI